MRAASGRSPSAPTAATCSRAEAGGLIVQWDVRTGEREFDLRHRHQEEGVAPGVVGTNGPEPYRGTIATYGPDGQTIVSAGQDQWVMIWDVATRQLRDQVQVGANIYRILDQPRRPAARPGGTSCPGSRSSTWRSLTSPAELCGERATASSPWRSARSGQRSRWPVMAGLDCSTSQSGQILDLFDEPVNMSPFSLAFGAGGHMLAMAVGDRDPRGPPGAEASTARR